MITCSSCNHQNEDGSSFCENCGHDLREMAVPAPQAPLPQAGGGPACPNCGFSNIPGAAFCENCGTKLEQVLPPAVPEPVPAPPPPAQQSSGGDPVCQNCGHQNVPGSIFCENCGSQMSAPEPPAEVPEEQPAVPPAPPVPPEKSAAQPVAPPAESVEQPVPPPVAPPAPQPVSDGNLCPQCGFSNPDGTVFCGNCGYQLGEAPVTPEIKPAVEEPPSAPQPLDQITGKLVVQKTGGTIEIPPELKEAIVGREDPVSGIFPEIDLDPHGGHDGGVGRKHARLFIQGTQLMIEDLDSVNGTLVNKQKLAPRQPHEVQDGSELRFGKIIVTYHAS